MPFVGRATNSVKPSSAAQRSRLLKNSFFIARSEAIATIED
jgi:hypothetical protein